MWTGFRKTPSATCINPCNVADGREGMQIFSRRNRVVTTCLRFTAFGRHTRAPNRAHTGVQSPIKIALRHGGGYVVLRRATKGQIRSIASASSSTQVIASIIAVTTLFLRRQTGNRIGGVRMAWEQSSRALSATTPSRIFSAFLLIEGVQSGEPGRRLGITVVCKCAIVDVSISC